MTTLNLTDPVNGTVADANLIATNNSLIESAINGGIDSSNITDGSLTNTDLSASAAVLGSKLQWSLGSTPPGSPANNDLWIYNGISGVFWLFVYDSTESTYKWKFIGGPPARAEVETDQSTASASYVDLGTAGPSITVPRAGDYLIQIDARVFLNAAAAGAGQYSGFCAAKLGAASAADGESLEVSGPANAGSGNSHTPSRSMVRTLAASDVVKMQYRSALGTTSFSRRELRISPVRVI